ncbi:MAG TPA: ABC transporter permease [Candidatus Saccharimonadales bacterium]|nr:ABC transporter permease [Candidatus Saccharimonadales bacterium]
MSSAVSQQRRAATGGGLARPPSHSVASRIYDSAWTYRLIAFAIFATVWQLYAQAADSLLIPTFTETVEGLVTLLTSPETYQAFLLSNQALVIGFSIAVIVGIPAGLAAARYPTIEAFFDPYLSILLVTPMAALIPILLMSLGIGIEARVLLVIVFAIPVIIVNSRAGVRQVDASLIEMATSYGATERQIWRKILIPGSLPAVMTGVRLGLGRGITGMVIIELLMVAVGIGNLILEFRGLFEPGLLYGVVVLVVIEALILVTLVRKLEYRLAPWSRGSALSE